LWGGSGISEIYFQIPKLCTIEMCNFYWDNICHHHQGRTRLSWRWTQQIPLKFRYTLSDYTASYSRKRLPSYFIRPSLRATHSNRLVPVHLFTLHFFVAVRKCDCKTVFPKSGRCFSRMIISVNIPL
jgi:hypothetical protein